MTLVALPVTSPVRFPLKRAGVNVVPSCVALVITFSSPLLSLFLPIRLPFILPTTLPVTSPVTLPLKRAGVNVVPSCVAVVITFSLVLSLFLPIRLPVISPTRLPVTLPFNPS